MNDNSDAPREGDVSFDEKRDAWMFWNGYTWEPIGAAIPPDVLREAGERG